MKVDLLEQDLIHAHRTASGRLIRELPTDHMNLSKPLLSSNGTSKVESWSVRPGSCPDSR